MKRILLVTILVAVSLVNAVFVLHGSLPAQAVMTPPPPTSASAAPGSDLNGVELTIDKVFNIIVGIACWLIRVAGVLIVIAIIFYGLKFLVSQGDPGKVGDARKGFLWAVVGIVVIMGTYVIIKTVYSAVGGKGTLTIFSCSGK